jgi:hypothetical protein
MRAILMTPNRRTRLWHLVLKFVGADPGPPGGPQGRWPSTWQGFLWDLTPGAVAPRTDGVVAPASEEADWIVQVPDDRLGEFFAAEQIRNQDAQAAVATTEAKASRLLTPIVALLTGTVALVALELHEAASRAAAAKTLPLIGGALGSFAALLLVVAAVRAIDADTRVGIYRAAGPGDLLAGKREALRAEAYGTELARWSSRSKATRVMYARAAFSRAVALIIIALVLGAATLLTGSSDARSNQTPCPTIHATDTSSEARPEPCP